MTASVASHCARLAETALLQELNLTPKPGLVDRNNSGAHTDMDYALMCGDIPHIGALVSRSVQLAAAHQREELTALERFRELRQLGREAEAKIFQKAPPVNTYKGIVFFFSILTYALIDASFAAQNFPDELSWRQSIREIARPVLRDYSEKSDEYLRGFGYQAHCKSGRRGAREEAVSGFATFFEITLPSYERALAHTQLPELAAKLALLETMAVLEDSNFYHRLGELRARFWQTRIQEEVSLFWQQLEGDIPAAAALKLERLLLELDQAFIAENASPGGTADHMAALYYVLGLREELAPRLSSPEFSRLCF